MTTSLTVAEVAERLGGTFEGDGAARVHGLAPIAEAEAGDLSFVTDLKYAPAAAATRATAVIVSREWDQPGLATLIRTDNPDAAFTQIAAHFAPPPPEDPRGIHPSAIIAEGAELAAGVGIGAHVVVEAGVRIGAETVVMAGCYVGQGVTIGRHGRIYPNVTIREYTRIGDRVLIHAGTVIGSDGFGFVPDESGARQKVPQVGIVEIGDDVELGANVTIDRARFGKTRIENGVKVDNLVQIAHNVTLHENAVVIAQVGIAGSTEVGSGAIIAGQAGVSHHLKIGARAMVGGGAAVTKDIAPGARVFGSPALPLREYAGISRHYHRLPKMEARLKALEKKVADLTEDA